MGTEGGTFSVVTRTIRSQSIFCWEGGESVGDQNVGFCGRAKMLRKQGRQSYKWPINNLQSFILWKMLLCLLHHLFKISKFHYADEILWKQIWHEERETKKKFNLPQTFDFILTFSGKCFFCNVSNGFQLILLCSIFIHSFPTNIWKEPTEGQIHYVHYPV